MIYENLTPQEQYDTMLNQIYMDIHMKNEKDITDDIISNVDKEFKKRIPIKAWLEVFSNGFSYAHVSTDKKHSTDQDFDMVIGVRYLTNNVYVSISKRETRITYIANSNSMAFYTIKNYKKEFVKTMIDVKRQIEFEHL